MYGCRMENFEDRVGYNLRECGIDKGKHGANNMDRRAKIKEQLKWIDEIRRAVGVDSMKGLKRALKKRKKNAVSEGLTHGYQWK